MRVGRNVLKTRCPGALRSRAGPVSIAGVDGSESHRIAPQMPVAATAQPVRRRVAIALAAWVVVAGGALGIAKLMTDDPAPVPELVAQPPNGLPVLRLFLDRSLPADVQALPTGNAQAQLLQEQATRDNDPARWVELGSIAHAAGNLELALGAYQQALTIQPGRLDATVGIAMVDGATGPEGLDRAAQSLTGLETANPKSQLLYFNAGMVAIYRADAPEILRNLRRAAALDPDTELAKLATQLTRATPKSTGNP